MSSSLDELAVRIGELPQSGMVASIRAVKKIARIEAIKVAGGDMRLSGFGRNRASTGGAKLSTRDNYKGGAGAASAVVYAVPPGLWSIVTDGAAPHVIGFGRSNRKSGNYSLKNISAARGGRKAGGDKRLRMPGTGTGWRTGPVFHPGTRGKGAWTKVRARSFQLIPEIYAKEFRKLV